MASKRKFRLRAILTLAIALIVLMTVGLAALLANNLIAAQFERYVTGQQSQRIRDIAGGLDAQYNPATGWNEALVHAAGMYALYDGYIIKVYDGAGRVVWDAQHHGRDFRAHEPLAERGERPQDVPDAGADLRRQGRRIGRGQLLRALLLHRERL